MWLSCIFLDFLFEGFLLRVTPPMQYSKSGFNRLCGFCYSTSGFLVAIRVVAGTLEAQEMYNFAQAGLFIIYFFEKKRFIFLKLLMMCTLKADSKFP